MGAAEDSSPGTTVAVAVSGERSRSSRRAVRWAVEHLEPLADRFLLIHVVPSVSSVPSPSGKLIPIKQVPSDVMEIYLQERKLKLEAVFLPFKRLCKFVEVDTLVLAGDDPSIVLLKYLSESPTKSLVLGSSTLKCIARKLKYPGVSSTVLKSAANDCNIYVVSRHKLRKRLANVSLKDEPSSPKIPNSVNLWQWIRKRKASDRKPYGLDKSVPLLSEFLESKDELNLQTSEKAQSNDICYQSPRDDSFNPIGKFNSHSPSISREEHSEGSQCALDNVPLETQMSREQVVLTTLEGSLFNIKSGKQSEAQAEVKRLRLELKKTFSMYNQACKDLIYARNKVQLLHAECSDDAKKLKDATEREEALKKIVQEEKTRHLEAIKEVEAARQLLEQEVHERQRAEMNALKVSSERKKIVETLLLNNKRYRRYTSAEIEDATDCFSEAKMIGEGGYGKVYKCNLEHTPVAIKVLRQDKSDKKEEFLKEIEVLSQLRHPHMVLLLGACPENGALVYEYMENGSLEDRIFCRGGTPPLPWFVRFRIIYEVACGLAFLHGSKPEPIVHRDLKPGNILLDKHYVSKIGDVGLAKLMADIVSDSITEYRDTIIAGTFYFIDPEYLRTGTVRPKSDLYAFGIIILQLLTGKHPRGLLTAVEAAFDDGSFEDILDKSITDWPLAESEKLAELALKCSALRCRDRPDLESEVMPILGELLYMADVHCRLEQSNIDAPGHFLCPILQEVMDEPYLALDGFTYERRAIKAWLEKHRVSPVTKLSLPNTNLTPNHSLRFAIQEWKVHSRLSIAS